MNLASVIVVVVLLWCFFFFVSLPFGVEREQQSLTNFGGVQKPHLWHKAVFASVMAVLGSLAFYWAQAEGYMDGIFS
ncbi:MAG: DUF1467 family protein [Alphaproteobacteria bacterium]|nr:DUF1467 family protein [Alphaproteobacteria bacterium]